MDALSPLKSMRFPRHLPALVLFLLILGWRFVQVRNLVLPPWVDSVHHALLVRILLEQGAIPETWQPYLPQVPFYYHFGFHFTAALLAKFTGMTVGRAVLVTGQVWQALLAIGVYFFGYVLWQNQTKALAAMLLVGFVSQMPAYYTTWGRYTLLAGVTLLIFGMAAALTGRKIVLALLVAATAITHFYALLLLCLFLFILILLRVQDRWGLLIGAIGGLTIALPWLLRVFVQVYQRQLVYVQAGAENVGYATGYLWYLLGPGRNYLLLLLALMGAAVICIHLLKKRSFTQSNRVPLLVWSLVLIGLMTPLRFGPFRPDHHAALVLFLPVTLLAVEGIWQLRKPALIWGAVGILALWGMGDTIDIINPDTILATQADVNALEWIEANTSPEAKFLIDVAPWSAQWRGADGGWWIMPLTGRQTVLPPAAYGWGTEESVQQIRAVAARIYGLTWKSGQDYCHQLAALMTETNATYYYTYTQNPATCPAVEPVYHGEEKPAIYQLAAKPGTVVISP